MGIPSSPPKSRQRRRKGRLPPLVRGARMRRPRRRSMNSGCACCQGTGPQTRMRYMEIISHAHELKLGIGYEIRELDRDETQLRSFSQILCILATRHVQWKTSHHGNKHEACPTVWHFTEPRLEPARKYDMCLEHSLPLHISFVRGVSIVGAPMGGSSPTSPAWAADAEAGPAVSSDL